MPPGAANAPAPTGTTANIASGANTAAIQSAINAAAAGTTLIFPAETFTITAQLAMKTGVSLYGLPGAQLDAAQPFDDNTLDFTGVSDVNVSGFICDGSGASGGLTGFMAVLGADNVHIEWNTFQNNSVQSDMLMFNSDHVYFRENVCGPNELQPVSFHHTDPGVNHSGLWITDNVITAYARMAIEGLFNVQGEYHVDRNDISGQVVPHDTDGGIAISLVEDYGQVGGSVTNEHGTIWGNTIDTPEVGIECGLENMTISQNVITAGTGFLVGHQPGGVFENNTVVSGNPYQEDGGYNGTEWIGANTVNGSPVTGWSGHGPYGARPTVYTPSDPPDGGGGGGGGGDTPGPTSLLPSRTQVGGGALIRVRGSGFATATAVHVGDTAVSFDIVSDTEITFVAPAEPDGTYEVTVTIP